MDILYLTLSDPMLDSPGIYSDLVHALKHAGHKVTIVFAAGSKETDCTRMTEEYDVRILKVLVGDLFGVPLVKKGINTLKVELYLLAAIKQYLCDERFDLCLYATPPVTFASVVTYCKKKYGCRSFLMLKDIFPQNAVDIGMFRENGLLHRFFLMKEKRLYEQSDVIGCMSAANLEFIKGHHPKLPEEKLIIFPNTTAIRPVEKSSNEKKDDKVRFVFGGNLGKPQGIDFLLKAITSDRMKKNKQAEFLIIGSGSEQDKVKEALENAPNASFISFLPHDEYVKVMNECEVGLISLDVRFTIPNYPSRTLAYMSQAKPILACTDRNTDIKELLTDEADCGLWCASDDIDAFCEHVERLCQDAELRRRLGENGRRYLEEQFDVKRSVALIEKYGKK